MADHMVNTHIGVASGDEDAERVTLEHLRDLASAIHRMEMELGSSASESAFEAIRIQIVTIHNDIWALWARRVAVLESSRTRAQIYQT